MSCCKDLDFIPTKFVDHRELTPVRAHEFDAGADLFFSSDVAATLQPGERKLFPTGVAIAIPEGFVGLIWPRSGSAVKKGFDTMAGVIDHGFSNQLMVLLVNHSDEPQTVHPGDRIAQLIIQKCYNFKFVPVDELPDSDRGEKGFGSSGA